MKWSVVTLFPELFAPFVETSLMGRALSKNVASVETVDLRPFGLGRYKSVDDTPYGGGSGLVLRVEPIVAALEDIDARAQAAGGGPAHRVLLSPQGAPLKQSTARALAAREHVAVVCGRYEGFDERIRSFVHEEVSLGDFVLMGGETAAMALMEATIRLLPNALGNDDSIAQESFSDALGGALEYPQYTRPAEFRGLTVPEILSSGDHAKVDAWRLASSRARTQERRPDLVARTKTDDRARLSIALVHHPVLDREGEIVTTAMTNLDLHDMARSARSFGASAFYVAHPIAAQRELVTRIRDHWVEGSGKKRIPDRALALELVKPTETLEEALALEARDGAVEVWVTAAKSRGRAPISFGEAHARLRQPGAPSVLLVFGTGWGLAPSVMEAASVVLEPIHGAARDGYNHLSVRAACAIMLDRLLGAGP